jgi:hypothetical protein
MLKRWYETRPFTFGAVFIFLYMTIPILDQVFMYPKMKPVCNGEITDQQARACTDWIRKKETQHVRIDKRGPGSLHRDTKTDEYLREQERAIADFGRTQNK